MLVSQPSKWLRLVDRANGKQLAIAGIALTVSFALAYWFVTLSFPYHGIRGPELEQPLSILDSLYFSVVTETTLGYGDFRPVGFSRLLVSVQVLFGLALAGLAVARITSARGRNVRLVSYQASGEWIEVCSLSKTNEIMVTHAIIFHDGETLRYDGENFDSKGHPLGFFTGELVDGEGHCYRFTYSTRRSSTNYFVEGIASVLFQGADSEGRWDRHQATAHDFGTKETTIYEGFRATANEASILRGSDLAARMVLIKQYAAPHGG